MDIKKTSDRIMANKVAKGFNVTNVDMEFALTYGELGEAYDSYIKDKGDVGEELADVMIYLLGLASILNVDLEKEVNQKLDKNEKRDYTIQKDGEVTKAKEIK